MGIALEIGEYYHMGNSCVDLCRQPHGRNRRAVFSCAILPLKVLLGDAGGKIYRA